MVAFNRIHCSVVAVSEENENDASRGALARDVLPWADPYVAQLIRKLQEEVRVERQMRSLVRHYRAADDSAAGASTSRRISAVR